MKKYWWILNLSIMAIYWDGDKDSDSHQEEKRVVKKFYGYNNKITHKLLFEESVNFLKENQLLYAKERLNITIWCLGEKEEKVKAKKAEKCLKKNLGVN